LLIISKKHLFEIFNEIKKEYSIDDPGLSFEILQQQRSVLCFNNEITMKIINFLNIHPVGVLKMSSDIPNLVETSINLAVVSIVSNEFIILASIRSSTESVMILTQNRLKSLNQLIGSKIEIYGQYPGWTPNIRSNLVNTARDVYKKLFSMEIKVNAIHAGLETGIIGSKIPGLDMISIGSEIVGPHSTSEKVEIKSVPRTYAFLGKLLEELSN